MDSEATGAIEAMDEESQPKSQPRGFAALTPEKMRELASRGGRAAQARGTAHKFSPTEARAAGRLGGEAVAKDRAYMSELGRRGAIKSAEVRRNRRKARLRAAGGGGGSAT